MPRPAPAAYAPYIGRYIDLVPDGDIPDRLARSVEETAALVAGFGAEGALRRYAPDKWGVKEVAGHELHHAAVLRERYRQPAPADNAEPRL